MTSGAKTDFMDIDLLSKMVKELILDNDRVVLPGLGCFVAETVPAYFSDKGYTINPPYRKLYFRARPDEGDALVRFYARSNDLSYEVAEKIIRDFVAELRSVLHVKKAVVFPGLGRLRATKENNVFFIADENLDIYPEGFGLEPISLKTHQETSEEVSAAVVNLKSVLESAPAPMSEPKPEPVPEPAPEPVSEATPEPVPETVTEVAPAEIPEATPELIPESAPDDEIEFLVEPMPDPEPVATLESELAATPTPESAPEPMATPTAVSDTTPAPTPTATPVATPGSIKWGRILLILLGVLAAAVIAYVLIGRLCPEWIDQFLYSPEELEIIRH